MGYPIKYTVQLEVTGEQIANNIVSVVEGHYSPWLKSLENLNPGALKGHHAYSDDRVYDRSLKMLARFDREQDEEGTFKGRTTITSHKIQRGLKLMSRRSASHFADLVNDNGDAITADVMLQYIIFGKVIYG